MAQSIGIGIIGMGWMGQLHSRAYRQITDRYWDAEIQPRLVICADEVEARSRQAQARFGFATSTSDWREVIAQPEVEAISITAPNHLHLQIAESAAQQGKHIYCEKPVGRNPEETAQIEAAARRAGVLTFVGYNYRWPPLVQYSRQLIQEGKLGKLTHYRGRFLVGYASNPQGVLSWRFQRELAGLGGLGDLMSHVIDMAHMLIGPVQQVIGNEHTFIPERPLATPGEGSHFSVGTGGPVGPVTNEDYVSALVRFANGVQGTFEVCRVISASKCQMAFEVHGTKGALSWDFERMNELNVFLPDHVPGCQDGFVRIASGPEHPSHARFNPGPAVGLGYDDLKVIETYHFLESISKGKQGEPGFAEALAVAQVQAAIIRSWERAGWEEIAPAGHSPSR